MENSLKGLIIAAGTIVTCLVISLGFFIANEAKASATNGTNQISKLNSEFVSADKLAYDGTEVSGSEVINAIRKFQNDDVALKVVTKKSTVNYLYTIDANGEMKKSTTLSYDTTKIPTDTDYINPTARFGAVVTRDANGTILGITFTQK